MTAAASGRWNGRGSVPGSNRDESPGNPVISTVGPEARNGEIPAVEMTSSSKCALLRPAPNVTISDRRQWNLTAGARSALQRTYPTPSTDWRSASNMTVSNESAKGSGLGVFRRKLCDLDGRRVAPMDGFTAVPEKDSRTTAPCSGVTLSTPNRRRRCPPTVVPAKTKSAK